MNNNEESIVQQSNVLEFEINSAIEHLDQVVLAWSGKMTKRENDFKELQKLSKKFTFKEGEIVKLNVGGTLFKVFKETLDQKIAKPLKPKFSNRKNIGFTFQEVNENVSEEELNYPSNFFNLIMSGIHKLEIDTETQAIFINRDPTYFNCILNYLRGVGHAKDFVLPQDLYALECLYVEARFYLLEGLMELIEQRVPSIRQTYYNN